MIFLQINFIFYFLFDNFYKIKVFFQYLYFTNNITMKYLVCIKCFIFMTILVTAHRFYRVYLCKKLLHLGLPVIVLIILIIIMILL